MKERNIKIITLATVTTPPQSQLKYTQTPIVVTRVNEGNTTEKKRIICEIKRQKKPHTHNTNTKNRFRSKREK